MKNEMLFNQTIRCYDNDGATADRYTVIYLDQPERAVNTFAARGMSAAPFHPQGIGQSCTAQPGRYLGKRIAFADLPEDCLRCVTIDCKPDLDEFTKGYLMAAFWTNDAAAPGGMDYRDSGRFETMLCRLHPAAVDQAAADCRKFQEQNALLLADAGTGEQNGHDFWLTRNGHGCGFWDRDYSEATGKGLTDAAHAFGSADLYAGDDSRLYFS